MMAREIQHANDEVEIFKLTGCLSKCNRYHYTATPKVEIKDKGVANTTNDQIPNYFIIFTISNGRNEVKEQVECEHFMTILGIIYPQHKFGYSTGFMTLKP